jgi:hypothetical protein
MSFPTALIFVKETTHLQVLEELPSELSLLEVNFLTTNRALPTLDARLAKNVLVLDVNHGIAQHIHANRAHQVLQKVRLDQNTVDPVITLFHHLS